MVGGNDYVNAGSGNDTVDGGDGDDRLYGGDGNDTISGDAGNDVVAGNAGNDRLYGRAGNDVMIGGLGADIINGDEGNDLLFDGIVTLLMGTVSDASQTKNDANDVAMQVLLAIWQGGMVAAGLANPHDGAIDSLDGGAGTDTGSPGPEDFFLNLETLLP